MASNEPALRGLTTAEAEERRRRGLVNRAPSSLLRDYGEIVARNLFTWFNTMVVPAAIALFILGFASDGEERLRQIQAGIAVSSMAIVNTLLSLTQEIRAKIHLDRLALLSEARVRVLRDNATLEVPAGEVVQDDCVLLRAGETIVADGPVLQSSFLEVDESLLTGESDPVLRNLGQPLLSGSFCVAGEGAYRAEKVGADSFAQRTATEARRLSRTSSPATEVIDRIVRGLTYTAAGLCLLYLLAFWMDREGLDRNAFVRMVAATITSMVPQGMVLTATVAFTAGALHMSRRGAMVQRLNAVETMAAIDVVCTDKTGTLTTNHLKLEEIIPLDPTLDMESIRHDLGVYAATTIDRDNRNMVAIRAAVEAKPATAIDQLPFKSQNRCSAIRLSTGAGPRLLVMGAVEALQPRFGDVTENLAELVSPRQRLGMRIILLAEGPPDIVLAGLQRLPECALRPLAMICLGDELRPEAGDVLKKLDAQGIRFKVVSGDNPDTVCGTVQHLDMEFTQAPVVSGDQLSASTDPISLIRDRNVFGRIAPHQKVQIVETLQKLGHRVAMIGDGVNDVLPIKKADLGIAMGAGSQASKTVAGLVLETNRFDLLPETLEEGRTILRNLRRSGKLFLTKNVYSFLLILGYFLGLPFPYEPQQVTLLNWSVIGIPAFAIALSRDRSTRPNKSDFFRDLVGFSLLHGVVLGAVGLFILALGNWLHPEDVRLTRTMLLTTLVLLGLVVLLRAMDDGETEGGSRWLRLVALAALPLVAIAVYVPPIAGFFQLATLDLRSGAIVIVAAAAGLGAMSLDRRSA